MMSTSLPNRNLGAGWMLFIVACGFVLMPVVGTADDGTTGAETNVLGGWLPPSEFYPRYIADPLRPQNALTIQWIADTEIPDTGNARFGLRLGGSLGIYRWSHADSPGVGWQLSFEGGFAGQFDIDNSWDNTGWDGFYGLYLSWMVKPNLGFRVGSQHNSSHIGDEYTDRTGTTRIHYTREEGVLGVAWDFKPRWTVYSELGLGNGLSGSVTFRLESGLQFVSDQKFWKGRASHYAAIDIRTYEETDWSTRVVAQAGYWIPVGDRGAVHRFAVELGTGRSVMGQFLWDDETWLSIGWYYDW
jgi:Protein of unknown function (DUF1207)